MAGSLAGFLVFLLAVSICEAASIFQPISDSHRFAALELFTPDHGSFKSLEETYEALRTFQILGIEKEPDVTAAACLSISETVGSSSSTPKDIFYALKANSIAECNIHEKASKVLNFVVAFSPPHLQKGIISSLIAVVSGANSLLDFYYSVGGLVLIKDQSSEADIHLADAEGLFRSVKTFSQSDGRWRYSSNNPESSAFAAGIALETLAGIVSLASSKLDQSLISALKNDISKLFDNIEKYDDGTLYFDDKLVDGYEYQAPLSTTSSVLRGLTAFAAATTGNINIPGDKILGLAEFFLGIGVPGDAKDFFYQIDALACLESNRQAVLSLTKKDSLKVRVTTVLSSNAPPLTVKLVGAFSSFSKDASLVENQELKFDQGSGLHILNDLLKSIDVGSYTFVFEVGLQEPEDEKVYVTGSQTKVPIFVTGLIKIENSEIAVLDSDLGSVESLNKLDLTVKNAVSLSANHLQKMRLSFQLTTPRGHAFKPHQAFLKLRHESMVEHFFVVGNSGKQFEIVLVKCLFFRGNFLGLVEKFFYLSGKYDMELTVGDAAMENSLLVAIGHVELDLPEAPEKAPRPLHSLGTRHCIVSIPAKLSSIAILKLLRLGVNMKNFPTKPVPATFAVLFHVGIGAVLLLYVFFWLKLDLFQTLKLLGFLGVFLVLLAIESFLILPPHQPS
ncbi:Dolichyl-diphosphooligosaccharide--protein glycosyltransferase subunit 2 [Hibiscus syriacus]|uniref:Dolichyl-diphosphooligosaccharide--protein glycosyltransferase subunit 2 n=1 Tax=Hibiscus syriacus TaxID=106335 RepID=A0A6A3AZQ2_HIBSY|nr:Dolichyl-diphosphooligosaccharide--protein glycosyltransferase subunit 2 [Hibiscus syriacus]